MVGVLEGHGWRAAGVAEPLWDGCVFGYQLQLYGSRDCIGIVRNGHYYFLFKTSLRS